MSSAAETVRVEVYSRDATLLGEGPLWSASEQALFWLDIGRKTVFRRGPPDSGHLTWTLPDYPGCLAELGRGAIAIAMGEGIQRLDLESGKIETLSAAPSRAPGTRFNDGKVDPLGRLWVGTMQNNFGPAGEPIAIDRSIGALYRFDRDGVRAIEAELGIPNTLAWSPDLKHFYFADSMHGQIYVYDFDADSGSVGNKRVLFEQGDAGVPDGSAIDVDGCLWNARWDGGAILRITPEGKVDQSIPLPVPRPTSCAFGGPGLDTLFVTSASVGLTHAQLKAHPLSGSVFAIAGVAQGVAVPPLLLQGSPLLR